MPAPLLLFLAAFGHPAPDLEGLPKLQLWATSYYIHPARSATPGPHPILDPKGKPLGPMLSEKDWCLAAIEGTMALDGVVYNFAGRGAEPQLDCRPFVSPANRDKPWVANLGRARWRPARGPFGEGALGLFLVPYRSIATDPKIIPTGSVLYIPAARGLRLPNGDTHDGFFFAADTGGAITGNHIDIFHGNDTRALPFVKARESATFEAYVIPSPSLRTLLRQQHLDIVRPTASPKP